MAEAQYYLPHGTRWPIWGSIGLTALVGGFAAMLNGASLASLVMVLGAVILAVMMFLWFAQVVRESESRIYNDQVDRSFRWGMGWFIFSEVCFFAAFFGALFYARVYSVPWLGGEGTGVATGVTWRARTSGGSAGSTAASACSPVRAPTSATSRSSPIWTTRPTGTEISPSPRSSGTPPPQMPARTASA